MKGRVPEQSSETEGPCGTPSASRVVLSEDRRSFRIERGDLAPIVARENGEAWTVVLGDGSPGWTLSVRPPGAAPGFCLNAVEGVGREEIASTSRPTGAAHVTGPSNVVLSDGRLFWIDRGTGHREYELSGWEMPGSYWSAAWDGDRWQLHCTPAGERLGMIEELIVLFVAEVLEREVWQTAR